MQVSNYAMRPASIPRSMKAIAVNVAIAVIQAKSALPAPVVARPQVSKFATVAASTLIRAMTIAALVAMHAPALINA